MTTSAREEKGHEMDVKLYDYLQREYNAKFTGWDFSYVKERIQEDVLPWDYKELITRHMKGKSSLLDIDTGGGEFLCSIDNLPDNTFATEGYEPNISIADKRLSEKGIVVKAVQSNAQLPFKDNFFDIVINRHGSYDVNELKRILSKNGIFITQQVGSLNAIDLNTSLGIKPDNISTWCLVSNISNFQTSDMIIVDSDEFIGKYRFYDIGSIVYYCKCIPWQVTDFTIDKYMDRLEIINKIIMEKGFIDFLLHRFYVVAQKQD